MRMDLRHRLSRLEKDSPESKRAAEMASAASEFDQLVEAYAGQFTEADAAIPAALRHDDFSPAREFAWRLRFDGTADLAEIMQERGFRAPISVVHYQWADATPADLRL